MARGWRWPRLAPRRADGYLFEEVLVPFVVGVQVILVPLLADSLYYLMKMVIVHHVPWRTVGRLLLFLTPEMMANAFPLATILAVSLGISRLAREGEWNALRLGGASLGRLMRPIMVFGLLASAGYWLVAEHLAPAANSEFTRLVTQITLSKPAATLRPQTWITPPGAGWSLYVSAVDSARDELQGIIIFTDLESDYPALLCAATAHYRDGYLELQDVVRHVWRADGTIESEADSKVALFRLDHLADAGGIELPRMPDPRSASEIRAALRQSPEGQADTVIDLHRRYAAPVSCLVLALLCVPLNLLGGRRAGYLGLLISALLVVVYFLGLQLGVSLARNGAFGPLPALGVWLLNLLFAAVALWLLWRARH